WRTLKPASSAVPSLIPEPIIGCSLTYRILIYQKESVNWPEGQMLRWPGKAKLDRSRPGGDPVRGERQDGRFRFGGNRNGRLENLGEDLHAGDKARAVTGKITAGLESVGAVASPRGN